MTARKISFKPICVGDRVNEFLILSKLGSGALANVFLAKQTTANRLVALKVRARNDEELTTLAKFNHPNIVRIFDQRLMTDGQRSFLYLEFVPGGTLASVTKSCWQDKDVDSVPSSEDFLNAIDQSLLAVDQLIPERSNTCFHGLPSNPFNTSPTNQSSPKNEGSGQCRFPTGLQKLFAKQLGDQRRLFSLEPNFVTMVQLPS